MTDTNTPNGKDVPTREEVEALVKFLQVQAAMNRGVTRIGAGISPDGMSVFHEYTKTITALRALSEEPGELSRLRVIAVQADILTAYVGGLLGSLENGVDASLFWDLASTQSSLLKKSIEENSSYHAPVLAPVAPAETTTKETP